jgi:hypothetical protein
MASPAAGHPGCQRSCSGGKGGLSKAVKVSSPSREKTLPSQQIEECLASLEFVQCCPAYLELRWWN